MPMVVASHEGRAIARFRGCASQRQATGHRPFAPPPWPPRPPPPRPTSSVAWSAPLRRLVCPDGDRTQAVDRAPIGAVGAVGCVGAVGGAGSRALVALQIRHGPGVRPLTVSPYVEGAQGGVVDRRRPAQCFVALDGHPVVVQILSQAARLQLRTQATEHAVQSGAACVLQLRVSRVDVHRVTECAEGRVTDNGTAHRTPTAHMRSGRRDRGGRERVARRRIRKRESGTAHGGERVARAFALGAVPHAPTGVVRHDGACMGGSPLAIEVSASEISEGSARPTPQLEQRRIAPQTRALAREALRHGCCC